MVYKRDSLPSKNERPERYVKTKQGIKPPGNSHVRPQICFQKQGIRIKFLYIISGEFTARLWVREDLWDILFLSLSLFSE